MTWLREFITLLSTSGGDLLYNILTLFTVQMILGIALSYWIRYRKGPSAGRLLGTAVGLTVTRGALLVVAVLIKIGWFSPGVVLPPLERWVDFLTLLWAAGMAVTVLEGRPLGAAVLAVILLISAGVYAAFASLWSAVEATGIAYNAYWQATVWTVSSIAVLLLAFVGNLLWRGDDWVLTAMMFCVWLSGYILQVSDPLPDMHIAGYVRLANLIALPMLASLAYRRALTYLPSLSPSGLVRFPQSTDRSILGLLKALRRIEDGEHDIEIALEMSCPSIAQTVGADMAAICLPVSGMENKRLRVVALHPETGSILSQSPLFLLTSRYPTLSTAIQTGDLRRAATPLRDPAVAALYRKLGFDTPGPLLVQPLMDGDRFMGLLMVGNPVSGREWSVQDEQVVRTVGGVVAERLAVAIRRQADQQAQAEWEQKIQQQAEEVHRLAKRAAQLETELQEQRLRAEELATRLHLRELETEAKERADSAAVWKEEIQQLSTAKAALEAEVAEWKDRAAQLHRSQQELQRQLEQALARMNAPASPATLQAEVNKWRERTKKLLRLKADLEEQLAQAHARQEASIGERFTTPQGDTSRFLMSDGQGNIILASQGARFLLEKGYSRLIGTPLSQLFDTPEWQQAVEKLSGTDVKERTALVSVQVNGQSMQAELIRLPDDGGHSGALAVMLYSEETLRDDVLLSLLHDLRSSMTSITDYADLLLNESVGIIGETQRQFLQLVAANAKRMERLWNDVVKVADSDVGQMTFLPKMVDVAQMIEEAVQFLSPQFREREVGIKVDVSDQLPTIQIDRDSLYQIITRLLYNACQCSRAGSEVHIKARLEKGEGEELPDCLLVSVTDTGGGIPPEDQQRVFHRFYRADNPPIAGLGDTGVDLSVAKALVETQGGRIWVESEMGVGSTFTFILPLSPLERVEAQKSE